MSFKPEHSKLIQEASSKGQQVIYKTFGLIDVRSFSKGIEGVKEFMREKAAEFKLDGLELETHKHGNGEITIVVVGEPLVGNPHSNEEE